MRRTKSIPTVILKTTPFVCLIIILLMLRSTIEAALPQSTDPKPPAAYPPPPVSENGWYVYVDPDGEFSFSYPPTAHLSAGQNPRDASKNILIQFELPGPYQGMSIRVEPNPQQLAAADIAAKISEQGSPESIVPANLTLETTAVAGIPSILTHIPSSNTELTVITSYQGKAFIISPVHDLATTQVDPQALEIFYEVLGTFKFKVSK